MNDRRVHQIFEVSFLLKVHMCSPNALAAPYLAIVSTDSRLPLRDRWESAVSRTTAVRLRAGACAGRSDQRPWAKLQICSPAHHKRWRSLSHRHRMY
jgi:hypothetical protein